MDITVTQVFQVLLASVLLLGLVVAPLVGIMTREIPEEDLKRDVREGL